MPTFLTHPALPLALRLAQGPKMIPGRLLVVGIIASILPDLDVLAFKLGIPYSDAFGHRGFSHSLVFAALVGGFGGLGYRLYKTRFWTAFSFLFASTASHGVLDMMTNGGLGIAWLWPFSDQRFFAPVQMIEVAPLGIRRFLSERGWEVLQSESVYVWLPLLAFGVVTGLMRRQWRRVRSTPGSK